MPSRKKNAPKDDLVEAVDRLKERLDNWMDLYENGGNDPCWPDGTNLNLVRNHAIGYKRKIKEICDESGLPLPSEYFFPIPPEVGRDYVARADEIRENAEKFLIRYESHED